MSSIFNGLIIIMFLHTSASQLSLLHHLSITTLLKGGGLIVFSCTNTFCDPSQGEYFLKIWIYSKRMIKFYNYPSHFSKDVFHSVAATSPEETQSKLCFLQPVAYPHQTHALHRSHTFVSIWSFTTKHAVLRDSSKLLSIITFSLNAVCCQTV